MSTDTSPAAVAAALAAKKSTPQVEALPGMTPLGLSSGVMTPAKGKGPKAPKASPPKAPKASKGKASTMVVFEEGLHTIKLSEIDASPEGNITRPEWVEEVKNAKVLAAGLEETKTSLAQMGQMEAIVVQRVKGGTKPFRMAAGYRRHMALTQLGKETILCRIEASGTDEARVLVNIVENEDSSKETTALGKLAAVEHLASQGNSIAEIAAIMGNAEDFIRDLSRLPKCHAELRAALMLPAGTDGFLQWSVGRQITRLPVAAQPLGLRFVGHLSVEASRPALAMLRSVLPNIDEETQASMIKKFDRLAKEDGDVEGARAYLTGVIERAADAAAESKGSDGDDGDGDSKSSKSKKEKVSADAVYPEGRVVKATVPFIVRLAEAQELMNAAVAQLEKAIEATGLKIPPLADAMKALEQAQSAYGKTGNVMVTAVSNLFGEKEYTAFVKEAVKASKA